MNQHLYGTLTRDNKEWVVTAEPHVIIRLKRLFSRARNHTVGQLRVHATPDIAEDLEWVLERWPLHINPDDREQLAVEADTARQRILDVQRILAGYNRPVGTRTPARPFRDYQLTAGNLAHTTGRLLLTDDLGLGKTTSAATLFRDPETLPAVVIAPTHLATPGRRDDGQPRSQWAREILESFPDLNIHVAKTGSPPKPGGTVPDVIVLNYHKLAGWADWLAGIGVRSIIFDEVQELRRSQSQKYMSAAALAEHCQWRLGLSATPIYNFGGELWNVMNVIAPGELGTRSEFGREWCGSVNGIDDKTIVSDMASLSSWLTNQGLMLRRTRSDVKRELPALQPIVHDLPADERSLTMLADADILAATMLAGDLDRYTRGRVAAEFDMRLRQATGLAKAPYVAEFARMLVHEGPTLLFGWHRAVYDVWAEQLADLKPAFYTGHETARQKDEAVGRFMNGDTDLLILSLRSGAGIDGLQHRCSTVAFGEFDWSPGVHDQCVGRVFRDGQTEPVSAFYLATEFGSDPTILGVLGLKKDQSDQLLNPAGSSFQMSQADPQRVKKLAEAWLESRRLDAATLLAEQPDVA